MTKKDEKKLSDRQKKALPFIIESKTYEEGYRNAGISKNTFYKWMQNPAFKKELDKMQEEITKNAVEILKANMTKAAKTLVSLLDYKENPSLLRFVCNDIIDHVNKFQEKEEIEKRLDALEKRVDLEK